MQKFEQQKWLDLASATLAHATKVGADAASVSFDLELGYDVAVRNRALEQLNYHNSQSASIILYKNNAMSHVAITDCRQDALCSAVERALLIAERLDPDPCNGLADKELLATDYPDLDLYHPWDLQPQDAITMALECESYALDSDKRIHLTESCDITTVDSFELYANTNGFVGHYPSSYHSISLALLAKDKNALQVDYDYTVNRDATKLDGLESVARSAVTNTVQRLDARSVPTGKYPIIFHSRVSKTLVRHFLGAISGGALYKEQSFLRDSIGKRVFPEFINIQQQPHLLGAPGSVPFDNEGVRTSDRVLAESGILRSYILGSYSSRRLGLQTTGNASGPQNVSLQTGSHSLEQLCSEMGTGLLITDLLGQGVNILTGNYSRGAFGYWVDNGEVKYPVEGFTLAGNLQDMFQSIVAVGNDVDMRGGVRTPSIWLREMTVAGA